MSPIIPLSPEEQKRTAYFKEEGGPFRLLDKRQYSTFTTVSCPPPEGDSTAFFVPTPPYLRSGSDGFLLDQ